MIARFVFYFALVLSSAVYASDDTIVKGSFDAFESPDLFSKAGAKSEVLPIEVTVNGDKVVAQNVLRTPRGPAISEVDAKQARLQWTNEAFTYSDDVWLLVSQFVGAAYVYDAAAARLSLTVKAQDLAAILRL